MTLGDLLNGAGALTALSALPMLGGLLLSEGSLARLLRWLAIFLALVLPIIFMVLAALLYLPRGGKVFFDFAVNDDAARLLYGANSDPYSVHAAYSFPFPTFYLYWLASAFGNLSQQAAWVVWWLVGGAIWLVCVVLLWRTLPRPGSLRIRDMLRYTTVAIPAIMVLWQGQTALFVLAGLVAVHLALLSGTHRSTWLIGGIGLAFATLIKPQLALVGLGIAIWTFFAFRNRRSEDAHRAIYLLGATAIAALILIGLTLILPGGVTLETYRNFISEALPQVARPGDNINVIGSPAFVAALLAIRLGFSDNTANLIANLVTLLVLALAIFWTIRRAHRPLIESAAGWAVWAMVAPRVTWTWYAAWCLPFFLLAISDTSMKTPQLEKGLWGEVNFQRLRLALLVIVLALLNLQIAVTLVEFLTILLLIFLLWTSFRVSDHA